MLVDPHSSERPHPNGLLEVRQFLLRLASLRAVCSVLSTAPSAAQAGDSLVRAAIEHVRCPARDAPEGLLVRDVCFIVAGMGRFLSAAR